MFLVRETIPEYGMHPNGTLDIDRFDANPLYESTRC
jgi:hypothetical protein